MPSPVLDRVKDPVKDTLVPLRTNFNAHGSVRWRTSLYLNLFHWPMAKNSGNGNGVCRYVRAMYYEVLLWDYNKGENFLTPHYLFQSWNNH